MYDERMSAVSRCIFLQHPLVDFENQEIYRCSNGGWVALSAFAVYASFKLPVRL
jgi:hypothetical protein